MKKFIDFEEFKSKLDQLLVKAENDYDESDPFDAPIFSCVAASRVNAFSEVRTLLSTCHIFLECEVSVDEKLS